jgi:hypothetical protein
MMATLTEGYIWSKRALCLRFATSQEKLNQVPVAVESCGAVMPVWRFPKLGPFSTFKHVEDR